MKTKEDRFQHSVELLRAEKYEDSLKILNQLIDEFPEEADYFSERGVVYFHMKNKNAALKDLDKAAELQPLKSYRYSSRAYIKGIYKLTDEAIADYKKAIELDPEDAVAQNNLGMLEEQLGYKGNAKKRFDEADKLAGRANLGIHGEEIEARNIQEEINEENANKSLWKELKAIGSKEGVGSFLRFVKSGFKKT